MGKLKHHAYVRLETDEVAACKKEMLAVEKSMAQIIFKISAYKKLRKEEVKDRFVDSFPDSYQRR